MIHLSGKKLNPIISRYSDIEAKRFGIYIINYSIDKRFIDSLDDDIFVTTKSNNGQVQILDFKTKKVNILLEKVTKKLQKTLIELENGNLKNIELADTFNGLRYKAIKHGVVCELPTGILSSNALFANVGPVIPIKFNFIGDVLVNLNTRVHTYGINSIYLEVNIHIEVTEQITMPMKSKQARIKTTIPLAIKIIQGKIPEYYQPFMNKESQTYSLSTK